MHADIANPIILSIKTATPVCSVALHINGELAGLNEIFTDKSHSSSLVPMIVELLKKNGIDYGKLNAVAVSKGPGSYTGLRIGVSTAKGICFARNIPLIGVRTLEALARQAVNEIKDRDSLYCPMLDARRMEVYTMLMDAEYKIIESESAKIIEEGSFSDRLKTERIIFLGPGSDKCRKLLNHQDHATFVSDYKASASTVGEIAHNLYLGKKFENTALFEPFYLKEFQTTVPKSRI
jgi:tRNA threonylcarbamoyladenosine biosynthesis protein TsaB